MMTEFKCQIAQRDIDDLKFRISQTRWTDEIKDSGWQYGASLSYIKELADYWLNKFDWRKLEDEINPPSTARIACKRSARLASLST